MALEVPYISSKLLVITLEHLEVDIGVSFSGTAKSFALAPVELSSLDNLAKSRQSIRVLCVFIESFLLFKQD